MDLQFIGILIFTMALSWWLSGYDTRLVGDNRAADLRRRLIRSSITVVLVTIGVGVSSGGANFGGFIFIAIASPLAIVWAGCLSEFFARAAHSLIDSPDSRPHDPGKLARELDELAALVKEGRNEEAIRLSTRFLQTQESSALAMDTVLSRVYDQMFSDELLLPAATETERLVREGHPAEAESRLRQLLRQEKHNLAAAISLLRLYARDLHSADKAKGLLDDFSESHSFPPGFQEYARQRMNAWLNPPPRERQSTEGIESLLVAKRTPPEAVDQQGQKSESGSVPELLSAGHLGTAIEILEKELAERPQDFDLWITLAEAYGVHCRNLDRATKIVARMEGTGRFTAQQIKTAGLMLNQWRDNRSK
jgi:hypothetical protein